MLAELHGKISSSGSNLSNKMEDKLTGDFFGILRYLPYNKGLKHILSITKFFNEEDKTTFLTHLNSDPITQCWDSFFFWPYDQEGELDVLIDCPCMTIGIEVKYESGLSSDDVVDNAQAAKNQIEFSQNQLARESRIVARSKQDKHGILLFLAREPDVENIAAGVVKRGILHKDIIFGYLSWEECLEELKRIRLVEFNNDLEQVMIDDLIKLLTKKGFERFKRFGHTNQMVSSDLVYSFQTGEKSQIFFENAPAIDEGVYYEFV